MGLVVKVAHLPLYTRNPHPDSIPEPPISYPFIIPTTLSRPTMLKRFCRKSLMMETAWKTYRNNIKKREDDGGDYLAQKPPTVPIPVRLKDLKG